MTGAVLHVDLDQFIAAVEVLRQPELAGKPVIVGGRGDPAERAVVSTASYEARACGVGSGMPLRLAVRKCPEAVLLPVDHAAYDEASAAVMDTLRSLEWGGVPVLVEVLGWDEAFLGPGPEHGDLADPIAFAHDVRDVVLHRTRLRCGVGVGDNKLQAKLATGFAKQRVDGALAREAGAGGHEPGPGGQPRGTGVYRISSETWAAEMGHRSTDALWGIGAKTARWLAGLGITTVTDLGDVETALLAAEIGPRTGPWLRRLGRGVDTSPVDPSPWVARGHGHEETFQQDLVAWPDIVAATRRLCGECLAEVAAEGRPVTKVEIKVRLKPFFTVTRGHKLPEPTLDPALLAEEAVALLEKVEKDRPVRLIGVRLEMAPPPGGY